MKSRIFLLLFQIFFQSTSQLQCDIIQWYTNGSSFEVGLYAGRNIQVLEIFEKSVGFHIPHAVYLNNELRDYAFGVNETHVEVSLGYQMLYNHAPAREDKSEMTLHYMEESNQIMMLANERYWDIRAVNAVPFRYGQQIFNCYGAGWFVNRGTEISPCQDPKKYKGICFMDETDLNLRVGRIPGCAISYTKLQNDKLYAQKDFAKGEYIQVSRALLLPAQDMLKSKNIQAAAWFKGVSLHDKDMEKICTNSIGGTCMDDGNAGNIVMSGTKALLVLGYGALYRGVGTGSTEIANVDISWWNVDAYMTNAKNEVLKGRSLEDYQKYAYTTNRPINPEEFRVSSCANRVFISFVANKDIRKGQELTVSIYTDYLSRQRFVPSHMINHCFD